MVRFSRVLVALKINEPLLDQFTLLYRSYFEVFRKLEIAPCDIAARKKFAEVRVACGTGRSHFDIGFLFGQHLKCFGSS